MKIMKFDFNRLTPVQNRLLSHFISTRVSHQFWNMHKYCLSLKKIRFYTSSNTFSVLCKMISEENKYIRTNIMYANSLLHLTRTVQQLLKRNCSLMCIVSRVTIHFRINIASLNFELWYESNMVLVLILFIWKRLTEQQTAKATYICHSR